MANILDLPEIRERLRRLTVSEYEKLGDDFAWRHTELIRGVVVNKMSKSSLHSKLITRIYIFFVRLLPERKYLPRQEQPLRLSDSMPEPDISVMRRTPDDFGSGHPTTAELVVEVAVSSAVPDRENASLYAEADVMEYWIVLGEAEQVEVYRRPENGVYQEKRTYARGEVIEGVSVTDEPVPVEMFFH